MAAERLPTRKLLVRKSAGWTSLRLCELLGRNPGDLGFCAVRPESLPNSTKPYKNPTNQRLVILLGSGSGGDGTGARQGGKACGGLGNHETLHVFWNNFSYQVLGGATGR